MASSEGVIFRWEAFNRWCDDYADKHDGMKPKVEDVRKWHRENAEKVWPDSNERPSVFLAVSHNKGRRVRGHKTCEYYKRYRAGKAAEQQLAARLQPAALSGRRILAVTAAARKVNIDCTRTVVKRASPDVFFGPGMDADGGELRDLAHVKKRRRMRSLPQRPFGDGADGSTDRPSDGPSEEDGSWASGADTSNGDGEDDDSGSGAREAAAAARHCSAQSYQHPLRVHGRGSLMGVHITVVRRDADGRTIQVETQPARGAGLHGLGARQSFPPVCDGSAAVDSAPEGGARLSCRGLRDGAVAFGDDDGAAWDGADLDPAPTQWRGYGLQDCGCQGGSSPPGPKQQQPQQPQGAHQRQLSGGAAAAAQGWTGVGPPVPAPLGVHGSAGEGCYHPGVAPVACRRARSSSGNAAEQLRPPPFAGFAVTPLGSMPVYGLGGGGVSSGGAAAGRHERLAQWGSGIGVDDGGPPAAAAAVVDGVSVAARDPLDLLAEAACDALESPGPAGQEVNEEVEEGAAAAAGSRQLSAAAAGDRSEAARGSDDAAPSAEGPAVAANGVVAIAPTLQEGIRQEGSSGSADVGASLPLEPAAAAGLGWNCGRKAAGSGGAPALPVGSSVAVMTLCKQGGFAGRQPPPQQKPLVGAAAATRVAAKLEPPETAGQRICGTEKATGCDAVGTTILEIKPLQPDLTPDCMAEGSSYAGGPKGGCGAAAVTRSASGSTGFGFGGPQKSGGAAATLTAAPTDSLIVPALASVLLEKALFRAEVDHRSANGAAFEAALQPVCGDGGATAATLASAPSSGDGSAVALPLIAELEAVLAGRVPGHAVAAGLATALLQERQGRSPLASAAGGVGLALVTANGVSPPPQTPLPPAPPLAAALPGALGVLQPPPPPAVLGAAAAVPMPLLRPASLGSVGGAPAANGAAAAVAPFTGASTLGGALAGAGAGGVGPGGQQLLPLVRLLQMQMAASRGLDHNLCHD